MIEFPIDDLRTIADESTSSLSHLLELCEVDSDYSTVTPLEVAIILNAAVEAGLVLLPGAADPDANPSHNSHLEPLYTLTAIDPATPEYDQEWLAHYPDGRTELVAGDGTPIDNEGQPLRCPVGPERGV